MPPSRPQLYKSDVKNVFVFGFKTPFGACAGVGGVPSPSLSLLFQFRPASPCTPCARAGGGKSTGFGLIYDSQEAAAKFEPRYRLVRAGMKDAKKRTRKQWKDLKKKRRTTWGTGRRAEARKARKAAAA